MAASTPDPLTAAIDALINAGRSPGSSPTVVANELNTCNEEMASWTKDKADTLATLATQLENFLANPAIAHSCQNYQAISSLAERLKIKAQLLKNDKTPEDRRALLQNAQSWAMHFSTVRMTVSTFLIGMIWAVFNLKGEDADARFFGAAVFLAAIAALFMVIFTAATYKKMDIEKKLRNEIRGIDVGQGEQQQGRILREKVRRGWVLLQDDWSLGLVLAVLFVLVGWIWMFFQSKNPTTKALDANLAKLGSTWQHVADNLREMNSNIAANQQKVADLQQQIEALHQQARPAQVPAATAGPTATASSVAGGGG